MPSRLSTARPPTRPISMAKEGLTTPSMAAAMIGIGKRWPQSSQEMSTSVGLMVRAPGTSAMSSKPYAARAFRPRPTHIPIRPASWPHPAWARRRVPAAETLYVENRARRPTVGWGEVYERSAPGVNRGSHRGPRVSPLPEHPQTLELEILVHELQALHDLAHLAHQAPGSDHLHVTFHLPPHALDQPVDEPGPAVDHPGLDVGHGVPADGVLRPHQLDAEEPRGARDQRLRRGVDTGRDRAADELATSVHAVEAGGGAEVHHDERGAVERDARHAAHHAVRPDLARHVDVEPEVGGDPGLHGQRAHPEVPVAHPLERLLDRRDHVGDRHTGDVLLLDAAGGEQGLDEDAPLVGGLLAPRGEAPGRAQAPGVVDAQRGVGVADVNDEQHGPLPPRPPPP